jgi:hypothetical protein
MIASTLTAVVAIYLAVALTLLGKRRPAYSHARHTISELGEFGSADRSVASFGVFLPVGLALAAVALLLQPLSQPSGLLALCVAAGYLVAVAFPCDPGSPLYGSWRQTLHNLGGAIEYFGGAYALLRLGEKHGQLFRIAGFVVGGAGILICVPAMGRVRGVVQRAAEACLFGGLILCARLVGVGSN